MKKRRMNLFRELKGGPKVPGGPSQPIKLGGHGIICIVCIIVLVATCLPTLWRFQQESGDLEKRNRKAQEELAALLQQTAELASKVSQERALAAQNAEIDKVNGNELEKAKAKQKEDDKAAAAKLNVPVDETWTSVLWKLSTFTTDRIVIQKMEFQAGAKTPEGAVSRKIVIDGQAGSQIALTDWMDQLANTMPTSEIAMDRQVISNKEPNFPIEFKVTAHIL